MAGRPAIIERVTALRTQVRRWREEKLTVGLVPTMGALHAGHVSLVERARSHVSRVVVSIFVNPAQFAPSEDFGKYPRTFEADAAKLGEVGVEAIFFPSVDEMYPQGFATSVVPAGPAIAALEDVVRPQHFAGVATVVAKLLLQAMPDVAVFGEKDFQQLAVVRRTARDLDIPTEIIGAPTMREPDGLAMSSRNVYLTPDQRMRAPMLHRVLQDCALRLRHGEATADALRDGRNALASAGFEVDYLELRDAASLAPVDGLSDRASRLLVAAKLGATRLIDNIGV